MSLFDLSEEYDEMLNRGLRLSGEDRHFFIAGRIRDLCRNLPGPYRPGRILDFGCGIGDTSLALGKAFPGAQVVGADTAEGALAHARELHGVGITFCPVSSLTDLEPFDLCYVNGVFHHIAPRERPDAVRLIHRVLRPGGHFALFENNPWNPGTRWVMSRVPFDRDAQMFNVFEARRLLFAGGFTHRIATRSLFYFPRPLFFLRFIEPWLAGLPLGAQYYVLASR